MTLTLTLTPKRLLACHNWPWHWRNCWLIISVCGFVWSFYEKTLKTLSHIRGLCNFKKATKPHFFHKAFLAGFTICVRGLTTFDAFINLITFKCFFFKPFKRKEDTSCLFVGIRHSVFWILDFICKVMFISVKHVDGNVKEMHKKIWKVLENHGPYYDYAFLILHLYFIIQGLWFIFVCADFHFSGRL